MNGQFPPRSANCPTGSGWLMSVGVDPNSVDNISDKIGCGQNREDAIYEQIKNGNVPDFMRLFVPVQITGAGLTATVFVAPDYLCIGTDNDFVRVRLAPETIQKVAKLTNCSMVTRKIVNTIWKASSVKIDPMPMTPEQGYPRDASMMWTCRWPVMDGKIKKQYDKKTNELGFLTAGHLKDVVITKELDTVDKNRDYVYRGKKVAIYGWHQANGQPIQNLNYTTHEFTYKDYSHGGRLMTQHMVLSTGEITTVESVLMDPNQCGLLSDEVPPLFKNPNYPVATSQSI
jgi:hypothetical protein